MKEFCVYKHESPNGKVYIGITSQRPKTRWGRGKCYRNNWHFYNAIQHYGWDSFKHDILFKGLTQEEACKIEESLIKQYDSTNPEKGYNRDPGGGLRAEVSEETRQKLSDAHIGRTNYVRGSAHPMYGKVKEECHNYGRKHTEEERSKMRVNNTRKKPVICIETGQRFESAVEAAETVGVSGGQINAVCAHKPHNLSAGGYHWCYVEEYTNEMLKPKAQKHRCPVEQYDLGTGETVAVYKSILQAEKTGGFCQNCIKKCCEGKTEKHKGFGWRYAE